MAKNMTRIHIVIRKDLVETIDAPGDKRKRSEFFTEAAQKEVRRRKLVEAAKKAGGSLEQVDIPGWETSELATGWVRASRHGVMLLPLHEKHE